MANNLEVNMQATITFMAFHENRVYLKSSQ